MSLQEWSANKWLREHHTLDPTTVRHLDAARKRSNRAEYDAPGMISEVEVREINSIAKDLRQRVERWLRSEHPELP